MKREKNGEVGRVGGEVGVGVGGGGGDKRGEGEMKGKVGGWREAINLPP